MHFQTDTIASVSFLFLDANDLLTLISEQGRLLTLSFHTNACQIAGYIPQLEKLLLDAKVCIVSYTGGMANHDWLTTRSAGQ